jgi:hypothetical protein
MRVSLMPIRTNPISPAFAAKRARFVLLFPPKQDGSAQDLTNSPHEQLG